MLYSAFTMIKLFSIYGFVLVLASILFLYWLTQILKSKTVVWASSILFMILYDTVVIKNEFFVSII